MSEAEADTPEPDTPDTHEHPVVLFDGVCNLCNGFVQFLIRNDPNKRLRFAPLQSDVAERLLRGCEGEDGSDVDLDSLDTVVLIDSGDCYVKSDAALRVAKYVGLPYRLLYPFRFVPRFVRDFVYDFVANHRYGWFGKRESCMAPTPDVSERFLVQPESPSEG
ncbi:MAG: thiol-disulfide oxidoreductase DCC family protein [Halobacteria archaeon]|nr:thiol-disulfide oxidoreductase DCC family protein [Halobacteria archaeon]